MTNIESLNETFGIKYKLPNIEDLREFELAYRVDTRPQDFLKIQKNLSEDTIKNFSLGYDVRDNQITIPETKNREFVNVAFRSLDIEPKTKYIKMKGCENWIFNECGMDVAREKGGVLVVSNQFDAMSAWQAGFKNVVSVPIGKIANGSYMDLFDAIPKIYIAFENTKVSKKHALEFATRAGVDKCFEIELPDETIDVNAYFKRFDSESFKDLIRKSKPYYKYKFKGLSDIIESLKEKVDNTLSIDCLPFIEFEEDWLVMLSGVSNSGKTSYSLNIAKELTKKGLPTLVMPFERGIRTVGKRFLQVFLDKTQSELNDYTESEWDKTIDEIVDLPLYFSVPNREEIKDIVARSKKLFNTKIIIVDHLDYLVRKSTENHNVETSNTLQEFKSLAQEFSIIFIIVHHIKKQEGVGSSPKKPKMEDLKGSSSTYQDPEAVIMLSVPEKGLLEVDIVKNKGQMGSRLFEFNSQTGVVGKDVTDSPDTLEAYSPELSGQASLDKF